MNDAREAVLGTIVRQWRKEEGYEPHKEVRIVFDRKQGCALLVPYGTVTWNG